MTEEEMNEMWFTDLDIEKRRRFGILVQKVTELIEHDTDPLLDAEDVWNTAEYIQFWETILTEDDLSAEDILMYMKLRTRELLVPFITGH